MSFCHFYVSLNVSFFTGIFFVLLIICSIASTFSTINEKIDFKSTQLTKQELKKKAHEMFMHAYNGYMKYAFPHDELMPVSCKGRERGVTPSRGDVDDSLGNFSLTLVDTLDTLIVVGEYDEFERAVKLVINNVNFESNLIVSVFETNIRMIGGLISGHLMSVLLKDKKPGYFSWYKDHLLQMAIDLANKLLPAFNTTSGVPYSKINLKYGMVPSLKSQLDTCTACGGTMILEWAALSRLTGNPIYEEKARRAMDFLWNQRNRGSDLMGTVLNINSGDWIRRDSGIGAGIDSYYEYTLKAYILLGEEDYLHRFNKHYEAVMRYLNKGPMFIDVHMHKPNIASRSFMDALLAFWPGVQVLKGDLKSAIEMHEMLYNVVKRHKFLPDAFTHDLQVHWAQHPLRPEFIESTYFLYRATKDTHYLDVAKEVMKSLEENVRTSCGFAAVKDVRTLDKEDQMESFVLAETFKYLYLIFAEPSDLIFDPDNYVLTTEAHFLPLTIGENSDDSLTRRMIIDPDEINEDENSEIKRFKSVCPNMFNSFRSIKELHLFGGTIRENVSKLLGNLNVFPFDNSSKKDKVQSCSKATKRLKAWAFSAANVDHITQLRSMGIEIEFQLDGKLQLSHSIQSALSEVLAQHGSLFMQEMADILHQQESFRMERVVQVVSEPHFGNLQFSASPAQFGFDLKQKKLEGEIVKADPFFACSFLQNDQQVKGKIVFINRGNCMFQKKAQYAQLAGAIGVIIFDNQVGSSVETAPLFAMSADTEYKNDIKIPVVLLFHTESVKLMTEYMKYPNLIVRLAEKVGNPSWIFEKYVTKLMYKRNKLISNNNFIIISQNRLNIRFNFGFNNVTSTSDPKAKQKIVELNLDLISRILLLPSEDYKFKFLKITRFLAYSLLGYSNQMENLDFQELRLIIQKLKISSDQENIINNQILKLNGLTSSVFCNLEDLQKLSCNIIRL